MNAVADRLARDDQELDALLRCLALDVEAPAAVALQRTWSRFETKLIRHLEVEDRFLLPLLEESNAADATRIRVDPARIRDLITELGRAVQLHTVRTANISELAALLEARAKHENGALYRLAGEKVSSAVDDHIASVLKRGVSAAASALARGSDRTQP